jgi:hypothetical protein
VSVLPRVFGIVTGRFGLTHDDRPLLEAGPFGLPAATVVRPAANEREVSEAWKLDEAEYGNAALGLERLLEWWSVYPRGLWLLVEDGEPIGSLGIWPLRRAAFHDIATGRRAEKQLESVDFSPSSDARSTRSWYCSGLIVAPAARAGRGAAAWLLLRGALEGWAAGGALTSTVDFCAVAFTPQGDRIARRLGMTVQRPSGSSVSEYPVYIALDQRPSELAARVPISRI